MDKDGAAIYHSCRFFIEIFSDNLTIWQVTHFLALYFTHFIWIISKAFDWTVHTQLITMVAMNTEKNIRAIQNHQKSKRYAFSNNNKKWQIARVSRVRFKYDARVIVCAFVGDFFMIASIWMTWILILAFKNITQQTVES